MRRWRTCRRCRSEAVDAIEASLKGQRLVPAGDAVTITASLPHGHVAAVHAIAVKLGLPALLGPASPERDLALALIDLPGGGPGVQAVHADLVGGHHPGRRSGRAAPPPVRSMRRWTGSLGRQDQIESGSPPGT